MALYLDNTLVLRKEEPYSHSHKKIITATSTNKYTNPARGILDFCRQLWWSGGVL